MAARPAGDVPSTPIEAGPIEIRATVVLTIAIKVAGKSVSSTSGDYARSLTADDYHRARRHLMRADPYWLRLSDGSGPAAWPSGNRATT
jgi:hypothetical protein